MTLTDQITRELLKCVGEPAGLSAVMARYSKSKGPFYHALANATNRLIQQLSDIGTEMEEAEARLDEVYGQVDNLEGRRAKLLCEVQELEAKCSQATARLDECKEQLSRADDLQISGFGKEELSRLFDLLAQIAASQGAPPEEGVIHFFQSVQRYESIVSFDLEAKRAEAAAAQAKAEMERWAADARLREVQSKARSSTIDLVEKVLDHGVKESDLPHWQSVLDKAGVTVEKMGDALEEYGSLEALNKAQQERINGLQREVSSLESQVNAF